MDQLTWRRGAAVDEPLLFALFAASKAPEFAPLGLSAQQLQPLLDMQFRARQQAYAQTYPAAVDMILCLENGTPVGRHLVERQTNCYRCVDLAILPDHQNHGIGTWAVRQIQQLSALESVSFRLCVARTNPALRLYERLGFIRVSGDELSYEMEWQPPRSVASAAQVESLRRAALGGETEISRQDVLDRIFPFLQEIGLVVHLGTTPSATLLPGIQMVSGGLRVDLGALLYPGDLLHEAGHLAVMTPERRFAEFPLSSDPAEEMGAIAWSYAATLHIGVAPEIVFHEHGYRGHARALMQGFTTGNCVGLPFLWWIGLTTQPLPGRPSIYPKMLRWLRTELTETDPTNQDEVVLQTH
jgi:ribosomal protein S18 acetylase RimI-like enzyme